MENSVTKALNIEDEVEELKMSISGYKSTNRFLVLVEGIDDVKVYEKFFNNKNVRVDSTSGVYRLVNLVEQINADNERDYKNHFIAIKDADFDRLNNTHHPYPNLFLTDTHDLETMLMTAGALNDIMKEYLKYNEIKKIEPDEAVLAICDGQKLLEDSCARIMPLSYIRWYNDVAKLNINFDCLKISQIIKDDANLGYECCLQHIKSHPANASIQITQDDMATFKNTHREEVIDTMQLIQGHDLCEMLCVKIKNMAYYKRKSKLSSSKISSDLRLCFRKENFVTTQLYSSIKQWLNSHQYKNILAC